MSAERWTGSRKRWSGIRAPPSHATARTAWSRRHAPRLRPRPAAGRGPRPTTARSTLARPARGRDARARDWPRYRGRDRSSAGSSCPRRSHRRRAAVIDQNPLGHRPAVVERRLADELHLDPTLGHSTVRTSMWSASSSAGGRVCGVTRVSSLAAAPSSTRRARRTQPDGVFHVVTRTFVPGSYARAVGWLIPYGPKRKNPASRSSRLPNTLGASKLGTHNQSIAPSGATRAPVWQFDRNAYSAIGGNGDGAAALCCFRAAADFEPFMLAPGCLAGGDARSSSRRQPSAPFRSPVRYPTTGSAFVERTQGGPIVVLSGRPRTQPRTARRRRGCAETCRNGALGPDWTAGIIPSG